MSRSAARTAIPITDLDERPGAAEMLSDRVFQARLAKARSDREKALAELGGDEAPLRRRKPWERRATDRPASSRAVPTLDGPLILTEQERLPGAAPVAIASGPVPEAVPRPTEPEAQVQEADSDMRQRKGSALIAVGFLAGIVIGAGVASLIWYSSAPSPSPEAGVSDDQAGVAIAARDVVSDPDAASPTVPEGGVAGSPAVEQGPPLVFAEGPLPISPPTVTATAPDMSPASDGDVSFAPSLALAPQEGGLDLPLPQQAPPVSSPTGFSQAVFLHAPSGVADSAVAEVLDALDRAGFTVADARRVRLSISRSNVRYFHPEDATAAGRLAEEIGAAARDFTSYRPSPPGGTIEVWLAGRSAGTRQSGPNRQRAERDEQLLFLRRLIIETLRGSGNSRP